MRKTFTKIKSVKKGSDLKKIKKSEFVSILR